MKSLNNSFLLLMFTALLQSTGAPGKQENKAEAPPTYSEVVDRAFSFSQGQPAEFKEVAYRIVLRFLPSSGAPESQVVFLKQSDGRIRVIQYRLKKGSRPISDDYNETLHGDPKATVEDVLKRVSVERIEQAAEDSTVRLVENFFRLSLPTKLSPDLCLDGTTFELWIQTQSNEIRASLSDCGYGQGTDSTPIIQWIRAVQVELRKQK